MGIVIAHWRADATGHYPLVAYRVAFVVPLVLQLVGLVWFFSPRRSGLAKLTAKPISPDGRAETV
jgi:hypothetical protein